MDNKVELSIVDIIKKYSYDTAEPSYSSDSIISWGGDNSVPTLLRNCYESSATLKAVIDGSVSYVLGDDIDVTDDAALFREQVNRRGTTMRQLVEHIAHDYYNFGNFAIQVIYSNLNTICELYPLDVTRCRLNERGDKVFYSKKGWTKYSTKSEVFDRFNRSRINPDKKTQIFFYNGTGVQSTYAKAPWASALNDVLTEIECGRYSLNSVSCGFSAKYILNLPAASNLTDEQKRDIEGAIRDKFTGTDTPSNFMLYFNNGNDKGIEVNKIEGDDTPEKFIAIKDNARSNIYTSLRVTPLLMGLTNASNGFSTQEYSDSFKLFQKTVIAPVQDMIIEVLGKILGVRNPIIIAPFIINFNTNE